jgi:hypothetical protein
MLNNPVGHDSRVYRGFTVYPFIVRTLMRQRINPLQLGSYVMSKYEGAPDLLICGIRRHDSPNHEPAFDDEGNRISMIKLFMGNINSDSPLYAAIMDNWGELFIEGVLEITIENIEELSDMLASGAIPGNTPTLESAFDKARAFVAMYLTPTTAKSAADT